MVGLGDFGELSIWVVMGEIKNIELVRGLMS